MTVTTFEALDLSPPMLDALNAIGFTTPTPVQAAAIPRVKTGSDVMVQSQTGTGKTAAFGIPILERFGERPGKGVRALILVPTRELARQVADECLRYGANHSVQTAAVYGGAPMDRQVTELRSANIVAGTPGRVLDHLRRGTLKLAGLEVLVLDEADEMLSQGFARELEQVMSFVPAKRQTLLFSATIPEDIKSYGRRYMREPEFLSLIDQSVASDGVEHHYYMVSGVGRQKDLVKVLEFENPENALIFANTRADSEMLATFLKRQGYGADYLNGDLPQRDREKIMAATKDKSLRFLVATDIAARGIDISALSHVVNYTLPESPEVYIHRTGRTGRAGHSGTAISLIGPREIGVSYQLKKIYKVALQERSVPTQAEIEVKRAERRTDVGVSEILDAAADAMGRDPARKALALRILERDDAAEVIEALLALRGGATQPVERAEVEWGGGGPTRAVTATPTRPAPAPSPTARVAEPRVAAPRTAPAAPTPPAPVAPPAPAAPAPRSRPAPRPGRTRIWINIGRDDRLDEASLAERLADLAGLDVEDFDALELKPRHSYFEVASEFANDVVQAVAGERLGSKSIRLEVARNDA
jgi:ATP-dependent RNA helicase DeaD